MIDSILSAENLDEAEVVFLLAAYEKTASSRKGTVKGPGAVIDMLDTKVELFNREYKTETSKKIKIGKSDLGDISNFSPEEALKMITNECGKLSDKFVFLLGGEHSVSLGSLQALAKKFDPKDVTILHI